MIFKMRLDNEADADLIDALERMPRGDRSRQAKVLLRLALAGTGGLLVRIAEVERRLAVLEGSERSAAPAPAPPAPTLLSVDAQKQQAAIGLFKKFGVFDD